MTGRISEAPLDPAAALEEVAGDGAATCVFAGTVRATNRGRQVAALSYEAHGPLGERVLRELEEEAEARDGVRRCRVVHRIGTLGVGDVSVVVAVAADSHGAAVETARGTMDELKERVPMWKEERYADGSSRHLDGSPLRSSPSGGDAGRRRGAEGGAAPAGRSPAPESASGGEGSGSGSAGEEDGA